MAVAPRRRPRAPLPIPGQPLLRVGLLAADDAMRSVVARWCQRIGENSRSAFFAESQPATGSRDFRDARDWLMARGLASCPQRGLLRVRR